jgi:hypothetical protein
MIGRNLEYSWGSFRLTLYYFIGFFLTMAISMISGVPVWGARYIHLSLFLAFAQIAPEMRILLFFFIPVKIKWLGWISWALLAYEFVMTASNAGRLLIMAPIAAFILFFGPQILSSIKMSRRAYYRKRKFEVKKGSDNVVKSSFHKCEVCGLTEVDAPSMDFRYCSKCVGNHEFCSEHLHDHTHRES